MLSYKVVAVDNEQKMVTVEFYPPGWDKNLTGTNTVETEVIAKGKSTKEMSFVPYDNNEIKAHIHYVKMPLPVEGEDYTETLSNRILEVARGVEIKMGLKVSEKEIPELNIEQIQIERSV